MTLKKLEDKIETLETRLTELEDKIFDLRIFYVMDISRIHPMIMMLWYHYLYEFREDPERMEKLYEMLEESARREYEIIKKGLEIKHDQWKEIREYLIEDTKRKFNEALEIYPELLGKRLPEA